MAAKKTSAATSEADAAPEPQESLSYEQAREELATVVRTLEQGGTSLEESLALWERGEHLATTCQQWLDGARQRLDAAVAGESSSGPDA